MLPGVRNPEYMAQISNCSQMKPKVQNFKKAKTLENIFLNNSKANTPTTLVNPFCHSVEIRICYWFILKHLDLFRALQLMRKTDPKQPHVLKVKSDLSSGKEMKYFCPCKILHLFLKCRSNQFLYMELPRNITKELSRVFRKLQNYY